MTVTGHSRHSSGFEGNQSKHLRPGEQVSVREDSEVFRDTFRLTSAERHIKIRALSLYVRILYHNSNCGLEPWNTSDSKENNEYKGCIAL